jgi:hypothetical protein
MPIIGMPKFSDVIRDMKIRRVYYMPRLALISDNLFSGLSIYAPISSKKSSTFNLRVIRLNSSLTANSFRIDISRIKSFPYTPMNIHRDVTDKELEDMGYEHEMIYFRLDKDDSGVIAGYKNIDAKESGVDYSELSDEELSEELTQAKEGEEYEKAARIRDEIKRRKGK